VGEVRPPDPEEVRQHPVWQIDTDPEANRRILAAHPAFLGLNLVNRAKPAATVLALWEARNMPVICVQPYGRGRSMAFVSDAAGGWGEEYQTTWGEGERDNRYYRRFWANAVRWLGENSLSSHQTEIIANSAAINYRPGEMVAVSARKNKLSRPEDLRQLRLSASWAELPARPATLTLDEATSSFRASVPLPETVSGDSATLVVSAVGADGKPAGEDRVPIRVLHTSRELADPAPDPPCSNRSPPPATAASCAAPPTSKPS